MSLKQIDFRNFKIFSSYETKKKYAGYWFILPWIIGVISFFFIPMVQAVFYIFNNIEIGEKVSFQYAGNKNLIAVFLEDPESIRLIATSLWTTLAESFLIVTVSLFIAILLNQSFVGRAMSRTIFAIPIIVSSGILMAVFKEDLFVSSVAQSGDNSIFQTATLQMALGNLNIDPRIIAQLSSMVGQILDIIWKSGVEIFLFLGGLQSIPKQLYEVSNVEGATGWQIFWKVTFPLVSPFVLLNAVYSIIDSFTYYLNPVMQKVSKYFTEIHYSYSTTLAVVYFVFVLLLIGVVSLAISRRVVNIER
jgi:ABC-type sugar transport system permease subunit